MGDTMPLMMGRMPGLGLAELESARDKTIEGQANRPEVAQPIAVL